MSLKPFAQRARAWWRSCNCVLRMRTPANSVIRANQLRPISAARTTSRLRSGVLHLPAPTGSYNATQGQDLENGDIRPVDLKVGDKIPFGKYSGTEVKMDGDELVVMREEDVMAVIDGK